MKTLYACQECNFETTNWSGKCPNCEAWNTLAEDTGPRPISKTPRKLQVKAQTPQQLNSVSTQEHTQKFSTNISEFDRVIGDGIIPGSLTLLSGEPGIGKSTLTLQVANEVAKNHNVLLISGEESVAQIANRSNRLGHTTDNLHAINEFNLETILETIKTTKPKLAIIDSIQVISSLNITSSSGSISQVRYCTEQLMELAKTSNIALIIIGHVTKDGNLAGPRTLEHLVDTVMQFEGDRFQQFRMLRVVKNRFGSCNEIGIFQMENEGLKEVTNPSAQFLEERKPNAIGSTITVTMEGTRPLLIEVQALTNTTTFGYPKRTANGFDLNRLQILIAVLEKYAKLNLQNQDVFVNIVGGMKLKEPSADFAVLSAIASSFLKKPISPDTIIYGEVGLSGELRKVTHHEKRKQEATKLGFTKIISPETEKEITQLITRLKSA
ncbi:DNA repair protein RadA [Candidatus Peregrinibacteria bacterium HGW-Peregrinibacteria-1]|jgi:DNA repair protein RadA/Sms|nr:MAG: DNA repair protein RadA [Candidatus Peregrinibacteria bacterium HGW-Peregrinibacteria-1]